MPHNPEIQPTALVVAEADPEAQNVLDHTPRSMHDYWQEKALDPSTPKDEATIYLARQERQSYYFERFNRPELPTMARMNAARLWYRGLGQDNDTSQGGSELLSAARIITSNQDAIPVDDKKYDKSEFRLNAVDMFTEAARDKSLDRKTRRQARVEAAQLLQTELNDGNEKPEKQNPIVKLQIENFVATRKQQLQLEELTDQFESGEITEAQLEKNITSLLLTEGASLQVAAANHLELQKRAGARKDKETDELLSKALGSTFERHYLFMYRNMLLEREQIEDIASLRIATLREDRGILEGPRDRLNKNFDVAVPLADGEKHLQLKKDITEVTYAPDIIMIYPGMDVTYGPNGTPKPQYDVQVLSYFLESCSAMRVNMAFLAGQNPTEAMLLASEKVLDRIKPAIVLPEAIDRSKEFAENRNKYKTGITGRVAVGATR